MAELATVLSADEFFARARDRLDLEVPEALTNAALTPKRGDHDLEPVMARIAQVRPIRPAAVLVGIVPRDEPMVLLTQRALHLPQHPGQISFPGGKIDPGDATPLDAALREAHEEIGLTRAQIEPLGYLDLYMTTLGFRIVPTLARIAPDYVLHLNEGEVDDAFEVPLAFLMDVANHKRGSREWQGMMRTYYEMPFGERHIWGVTAGILKNLHERIWE